MLKHFRSRVSAQVEQLCLLANHRTPDDVNVRMRIEIVYKTNKRSINITESFNMQQPQRFVPQSIPPGHMARFAQPSFSVLFMTSDKWERPKDK